MAERWALLIEEVWREAKFFTISASFRNKSFSPTVWSRSIIPIRKSSPEGIKPGPSPNKDFMAGTGAVFLSRKNRQRSVRAG